jgi:hypothetical protein
MSNNIDDIFNQIINLQQLELDNLNTLESSGSPTELNRKTLNKIRDMSEARDELFTKLRTLSPGTSDPVQNVAISRTTMTNQLELLARMEKELNDKKEKMKLRNINNLRLTEINTYYDKKYTAYTKLFRNIAIICIVLIILAVLRQRYIISNPTTVNILAVIVILVGGWFVVADVIDITSRDDTDFDEYNFYWDPLVRGGKTEWGMGENKLGLSSPYLSHKYQDSIEWANNNLFCVGSHCCDPSDTKWDVDKNKCVKLTETFQNLLQPAFLNSPPPTSALPTGFEAGENYAAP